MQSIEVPLSMISWESQHLSIVGRVSYTDNVEKYLSFEKSGLESFVIHLHTEFELNLLYLSLPSSHSIFSRVRPGEKWDYRIIEINTALP